MKTIQPVTLWYNGQQKQGTILSAFVMSDNLKDSANFSYSIMGVSDVQNMPSMYTNTIASGSLQMTGEDYDNWNDNEYAYNWIAEQLNLTITGEYVPPAPVVPVSAEISE